MMNSCRDVLVFVPACLLCPSLMANKKSVDYSWRKDILAHLNDKEYSIVPLPCPEATFSDKSCGLKRKNHGVKFYENLPGFDDYCSKLADQVVAQINAFICQGYRIRAIIGVEHSPTCSMNYMYTNLGTQRRQGIFVKYLSEKLECNGIYIDRLGINRGHVGKTIKALEELENKERDEVG